MSANESIQLFCMYNMVRKKTHNVTCQWKAWNFHPLIFFITTITCFVEIEIFLY